eukprot:symbB.v1.2.013192.t2/scaffold927.1/size151520/12
MVPVPLLRLSVFQFVSLCSLYRAWSYFSAHLGGAANSLSHLLWAKTLVRVWVKEARSDWITCQSEKRRSTSLKIVSCKPTMSQEQGCDVILKNTFLEFVPVEPAPEKMPRSHSCFASLAGQPGENQDFVETDISDVDAEDAKDGVHSEATSTEFDEDVTDGELSPQRTPLNILEALPADSWIIADSSRLCERICTTNLFAELLHEYIDKTIMVPKIMQRNVDLMVKETKNFELLAAKAPLHFAPCVALVPVPPGQIALNCSVPVIMGHMAGERSVEPVESDECKAKNKSLQKFINKKLCEAGQKDASSILEVVDMHLKFMNGINLATALHRFARCRLAREHLEGVTFSSMLARLEHMAKDMLKQPMSDILPVSCCSIIAWSCATLQTFRESLFTTLVEVMSGRCEMCQTFEVTNLLWACAEFQKRRHNRSFWIKVQRLLMTLLPVHFTFPQLTTMKASVLVSAFVSFSTLMDTNSTKCKLLKTMKDVLDRS